MAVGFDTLLFTKNFRSGGKAIAVSLSKNPGIVKGRSP